MTVKSQIKPIFRVSLMASQACVQVNTKNIVI